MAAIINVNENETILINIKSVKSAVAKAQPHVCAKSAES
jgi:hypothetical protein